MSPPLANGGCSSYPRALSPVACAAMPGSAATVLLTVTIAVAWVGVAQLARLAELSCGGGGGGGGGEPAASVGGLGAHSCTHLIVWLNGSSWVFLGVPWALRSLATRRRLRSARRSLPLKDPADEPRDVSVEAAAQGEQKKDKKPEPNLMVEMWDDESSSDDFDIEQVDVPYRWRHVVLFFTLALVTNYCYIAALEYIPASLNTAVFSTSPVLTLALSAKLLAEAVDSPCVRWLAIGLSVGGVVLISEPWVALSDTSGGGGGGASGSGSMLVSLADSDELTMADARLGGCILSFVAAAGTAAYQVTFKRIMGERLSDPVALGLFMAKLGSQVFLIYGGVMWGLVLAGVYRLDFSALPYALLAGTALTSLAFNFMIKFGLSVTSPVVVSLAVQLGIPLNLMIDLVLNPSGSASGALDDLAVAGVALMLASFTLSTAADIKARGGGGGGQKGGSGGTAAGGGGARKPPIVRAPTYSALGAPADNGDGDSPAVLP